MWDDMGAQASGSSFGVLLCPRFNFTIMEVERLLSLQVLATWGCVCVGGRLGYRHRVRGFGLGLGRFLTQV